MTRSQLVQTLLCYSSNRRDSGRKGPDGRKPDKGPGERARGKSKPTATAPGKVDRPGAERGTRPIWLSVMIARRTIPHQGLPAT
jgi:hypothetical protein